jgi:hypothetical protein
MFFLIFYAVIEKGGGTGPEKPWQPSLQYDWCQFHPGLLAGRDDGMHAFLHFHTALYPFVLVISPLIFSLLTYSVNQ